MQGRFNPYEWHHSQRGGYWRVKPGRAEERLKALAGYPALGNCDTIEQITEWDRLTAVIKDCEETSPVIPAGHAAEQPTLRHILA